MTEGEPARNPDGAGEADPPVEGSGPAPAARLLAALEAEYSHLLDRLSSHLRSREAAEDALHDAYIKLRAEPNIGDLRSPRSYLYRMAINLAANRRRRERRMTAASEATLLEFPADDPDPERVALASNEMDRALAALHTLPSKRRMIFLARWRDEKSQAEIAAEFGLHLRSVQKELSKAETYLRRVLRRPKRPSR
ncbi:RNA polymerase sigma factor [Novosphingobium sp. CF614]|uniref:RNA polymerase sigma factor n=1 Tax=Novosphingobium sp. CF614 TaxID=1884364 RepID=UPI000B852975|nr:sigma-70 family RNA polymerase sigma factor [Novosphingobium sp. CF614]